VRNGRPRLPVDLERRLNTLVEKVLVLLDNLAFGDVRSILRIHWKRAILGGILGTIAFDVLGLVLMGQWWDYPALLAELLDTGLVGGVIHHYLNGVILAVNYACVVPSMRGSRWRRALTYMTVEAIVGAWLIALPLAGVGLADLIAEPLLPFLILVRHWGYGLVLAGVYTRPEPIRSAPTPGPAIIGADADRRT
jgi:hypothetical protein